MDELRQTGEAPLATLGPRGIGRRYQQYSLPCNRHNTQQRPQPPTRSPPRACSPPPSQAPGGQVLRQSCLLGPPLCLSRPPSWGRHKFSTTSPPQSGNWLQRTRQRSRRYCGSAHSPTPKYCCVVPGDDALGTEGQEKPPNAQTCPPRVDVCLQKLPVSDIRSPCSGWGEGRLQAGYRKEPIFRVSGAPFPPQTLGGQNAQRGRGGREDHRSQPLLPGDRAEPCRRTAPGPT